jgi:pantoate--beta-alanine ligase
MIDLTTVAELKAWVRDARAAGRRIGLVPTMGALHEGHLALVDAARAGSDVVVMSVFVNPTQFATNEDLGRYPRDLARDRALATSRGVDVLFAPPVAVMYPEGSEVRVVPGKVAARWEGEFRPGHFAGVLTIVAKLFNLVEPAAAWFGQKDFQQATLICQMVRDLDFPLRVEVVSTVREPDGLALSSRNTFLSAADRAQALGLSRALAAAAAAYGSGEQMASALERIVRGGLVVHPGVAVEYIAVVDPQTLEPVQRADDATVVLIAARVGSTRLIDNLILGKGL